MTDTNEQTLPKKIVRKPKRQFFTMESWQDEILARKHIKSSVEDIRARLKHKGIKTQLRKVRGDDNVQTFVIFYGRPSNEGKKITYSDNDYLAIHCDTSREFPKVTRRKKKEDIK